jgi:sulfur relay protein TusB/DsrH
LDADDDASHPQRCTGHQRQVYNALDSTRAYSDLKNSGARLYALQQDVDAAGIAGRLGEIKLCDIDEFVSLSERCNKQMAWY